jgi:aspartate/methionine/tyrosine aminotransferase
MVQINKFEVEEWMDRLENTPGALNVAETCCDSVSIQDLQDLSTDKSIPGPLDELARTRMTYGAILGSDTTRQRIADLYNKGPSSENAPKPLSKNGVILTQGAIAANYLLLYSLVGPGDHVVCVYPTYQQLYEVPKSLGAEVSLWKLKEENGFIPDISELDKLVQQNTKVCELQSRETAWLG